ncbi:hypothetical protein [Sedimentibacter saalensis]|uniref:hypothetical protein n=1 Tax=Sedimentibacter saalensis TaxID=130788 RepID=UPI002899CC9C|nr:hypothetical protein [Sedimentibacter saalensis]
MKWLFINNYLMTVYINVLAIYVIADMVYISFDYYGKSKVEGINKSDERKEKTKLRDIIKVAVLIAIVIIGFIFVLSHQVKPVIYFFSVIALLMGIIVLPYVIYIFFQYIFIKQFDYELTRYRESALGLFGIITLFVYVMMLQEDTSNHINWLILNIEPVFSDLLLMFFLNFWYFSAMFFTLSFFVLILHKIKVMLKIKNKIKIRYNKSIKNEKNKKMYYLLSQTIEKKIEILPKTKILKRINYNIYWLLCIIIDTIIVFLITVNDCLKGLLSIIILAPQEIICNGGKVISRALSKNQGKTIIFISRISLVVSLLLVYFIDKYKKVFSAPGSEIYEFLCSVIIIPFLITELYNLKNSQRGTNSY